MSNGTNHVGSQLKKEFPAKYQNHESSDCITMVIWVLQHAFKERGLHDVAKKIGTLGYKGTELARYLINTHNWNGVYYNPDVNHPSDGKGEHNASYYNQVKRNCTYSVGKVPTSHKLINYRPSPNKVTSYLPLTEKVTIDYNKFKLIPFGVGLPKGGTHCWLYSYGKVFESHWDREFSNGLYTSIPLNQFPWLSGVIITPPNSKSLLNIAEVKCA
ncbi:hypothetical protein [Saccharophagus degradans]|uniref:Uncharacterized protein n=1 Tax=Saccharophagus degradans (strain 2-40 / ATCC 43961 / DSM 17024) TaxID=203122 RepID=Q21MV7_SACD2|nr:hypothetical protein [Saccharophagus degradans]ABD79972.1 hypothetical protein Sde_0710 [Saccharophagus degradans 2-40]